MADNDGLPSRVGAEEILDFVEKVTFHPGLSDQEIRRRVLNPKEALSAKRACLLFGLVAEEAGKIDATDVGKRIVYASPEERRELLLREVIMAFDLYEIPLTNLSKGKTEPFDLAMSDVQKSWSVGAQLRLSKDVLNRAATTFFRLLEAAGVGSYVMGRRGKATRLEMKQDGFSRLKDALDAGRAGKPIPPGTNWIAETGPPLPGSPSMPQRQDQVIAKPGYQVHQSATGSVVLQILPDEESVSFLEMVLGMLKQQIRHKQRPPRSQLTLPVDGSADMDLSYDGEQGQQASEQADRR